MAPPYPLTPLPTREHDGCFAAALHGTSRNSAAFLARCAELLATASTPCVCV